MAYANHLHADLLLHADIAVESKRPSEIQPGLTVAEAAVQQYWEGKTFPYILQNLSRIQYFILTTFSDMAVLRVDDALRADFRRAAQGRGAADKALRARAARSFETFSLVANATPRPAEVRRWSHWLKQHLDHDHLRPVPLSTLRNLQRVETHEELEAFAERLAELASEGIFAPLRQSIAPRGELSESARRDLLLFVMSQNTTADPAAAEDILSRSKQSLLDDFVAASIHSLIGRLFALKVIEDAYCVGQDKPLVEERLWVLNRADYNDLSPDELLERVTRRLARLERSKNPVVRGMAAFGAFFDWIVAAIDPVVFRTLVELFTTHDFRGLQGDLLGRFFEVYAQKLNRVNRRKLGQYYTPLPIVRFMWWLAMDELDALGRKTDVTVLDPGMGSGTFLREGARRLANARVPRFWERLTGFDISPQVLGIAQLNLYMSVLSHVPRGKVSEIHDLQLYTTDALDPRNGKHLRAITPLLPKGAQREFLRRSETSANKKRDERFWLIIGNPPYRNNSALTLRQAAERFPRLLGPSAAVSKSQKRYIRDDYAWFLAAADEYVDRDGMIVFVTSDSFLSHESFALFRRELYRYYELRRIVRLGSGVFQDVGPKISFVITVMARRASPLPEDWTVPPDCARYTDLRPLADGAPAAHVGGDDDPRFRFLAEVSQGNEVLGPVEEAWPSSANSYALVPLQSDVAKRVLARGVPVFAKGKRRLFEQKWPGVITALDYLVKADDATTLRDRIRRFLDICQHDRGPRLNASLEELSGELGLNEAQHRRLEAVGRVASQQKLIFDEAKIRPSFSGSIPNEMRWYPPPEYRHYLYYEPGFRVERNVNRGKRKGWGTMGQWRDPASHLIDPKLVFSSSTNPDFGLKAFVLGADWLVKLHGGKSQQYHYTGLTYPEGPARTTFGVENNLHDEGARLREALVQAGGLPEDVLYYVAGVYNSELAGAFLKLESGRKLRVRVPASKLETELASRVVDSARALTGLHRLAYDGPRERAIERDQLDEVVPQRVADALELEWRVEGGGRYRSVCQAAIPPDWGERLRDAIEEEQSRLDEAVDGLYA